MVIVCCSYCALECTDKILLHNPSKIPLRKKTREKINTNEYKTNTENNIKDRTTTTKNASMTP